MEEQQVSHCHRVIVYYEDTDFTGVVYHANYLKFMERAREHAFGVESLHNLFESGLHFVLVEMNLRFRAPAFHADQLDIETEVLEFGETIWRLRQQIKRAGRVLVKAELRLAVVSRESSKLAKLSAEQIKFFANA